MTPTIKATKKRCRCGLPVPVVSFRFVGADVELAVCPRCDGLTPRSNLKRENP